MSSSVAPVARSPITHSKRKHAVGSVPTKVEPVTPVPVVLPPIKPSVSSPVKPSIPPKKKLRVELRPTLHAARDCSLLPVTQLVLLMIAMTTGWPMMKHRPAASDGGSSQIPPATQAVRCAISDNGSADMYDADSDSVSAHMFIDDIAEEHNGSTDAASSSNGEVYDSPSPSAAVPDAPVAPLLSLPNSPECTKVHTKKGQYVSTLLADGHISDLVGDDNVCNDPNVARSPATVTRRNAIQASASTLSRQSTAITSAIVPQASGTPPKADTASTDMFLEDLGSPPPSVRKRKTSRLFTMAGRHHSATLAIIADAGMAIEGNSSLSSVVKTLVVHKPIDAMTYSGPSSVQVEDLTGIDDTPPSTKSAQVVPDKVIAVMTMSLSPIAIASFELWFRSDRIPIPLNILLACPMMRLFPFFSHDALWSFISYMQFTGHAPYCNLTTLPPTAFSSNGWKALYMSRTAVAMMVGVVMACHLFWPALEGGYEIQDPLGISDTYIEGGMVYHSISIMLFRQLWCHKTTMLSSIFKLPYMQCSSMTSNGPEFTMCSNVTCKDRPANKNKLPSPAQRKDTASAHRSPTIHREMIATEDEFVPIFDGHASKKHHFLFHPGDFDNLSSLPHYTPLCDLDYFTLIAVGYTPAMRSIKKCPHLNLNVQFVVVLGQAPNSAELALAGYMG
ncbi:hypothetical protein EDD18DRAFT_1097841 [Armillaria luteobubalina]|uniref:Uncharacterized protein n=1 Tax=Armillaria luteobubalina TaxID=153913 RepID=A0AA39QP55_9AGAR|nr:hypothetical protein EDD18DRAFT_1097841 [Armillaria luteobubalina]